MAAHFKPYGWICRAVGLFFVQGLQSKSVHDVRVKWKSWYTLYSVLCLLCFAAGEGAVAVSNVRRVYFRVRSFTKSMILVIIAMMVVRVTVNVATAFAGARGMATFFRKAAEYEKRTAFSREHHRFRSWISYLLRFFFLVAFFGHIVVSANLSMRTVNIAGDQFLQFALKAGVMLFNSLCFVHDVLHFVALKPCCEVLVSYILHQHDALRATLATGNAAIVKLAGDDDNGDLEQVRVNLCYIAELKKLLNDVWQYSIMASATVVLIITCVSTYCLFDDGISTEQLLLTMSYCFYSAVDFADAARLSQKMSNEASISHVLNTAGKPTGRSNHNIFGHLGANERQRRSSGATEDKPNWAFLNMADETSLRNYLLALRNQELYDFENYPSIGFFYELWLAVFIHDVPFTTTVYVVLFAAVNGEATLNATLTFVKAKCMQRFFCESSRYEQRAWFVATKNRLKQTAIHYSIRFLLLVLFAANLCTSSYLSLQLVDRFGCGSALGAALKLTCIVGNFLVFVYDAASFLVSRPCCEVARFYIEHQHDVLKSIVRSHGSDVIGSEERPRLVERVRLNLCAVSHLKRGLNESWKYAIAASGGEVLIASCAGIYLNFVEEFWTLENFMAFLLAVSTTLDFLDITILSDAISTEVREMRHTLRKAATSFENRDYFNQVSLLHEAAMSASVNATASVNVISRCLASTHGSFEQQIFGATAQIGIAGTKSSPYDLPLKGTPQGSILSPFLFNIGLRKLVLQLETVPNLGCAFYADDITLWATNGSYGERQDVLQTAIDMIQGYLTAAGMSCAPSKSEYLQIRPPRTRYNRAPALQLEIARQIINRTLVARILGMHVQENNSVKTAIGRLKHTVKSIASLIARIARSNDGMTEVDTVRLVHAFVLSRLTFALPFQSTRKPEIEQIDRLIRIAYKAALRLPNSTSTEKLMGLGMHNTYEELATATLIAQRERLTTTLQGKTLLQRLRYPLTPQYCGDETVIVPKQIRDQIIVDS
ncbi:hypothetical protein HPB51_010559 [Rhipicephalus microplus]|uniref:Reverse transcriptase domain-containing protein n=1 Tax=Rhipicephalus microplus TaxID=6941 RepID=A0A9J6E8S4_RHIMP|nr:hypothetical protein HPB51_010559 [Rhipicephalus microplus]